MLAREQLLPRLPFATGSVTDPFVQLPPPEPVFLARHNNRPDQRTDSRHNPRPEPRRQVNWDRQDRQLGPPGSDRPASQLT
jgi:hypothetical protein